MNKKLLFLTLAAQLGSCKLTLGMQQEAFLQHSQLYSDTSSRLSSLPRDVSIIILALILPTVQYDPVRDRHLHWAPATGEGEPTPSPLHFAAYNGLTQLTLHLIATGARKHRPNFDGKTPCDLAAQNAHYDLAGALLRKTRNEDAPYRATPLHRAARDGNMLALQRLLQADAWADIRDDSGCTALHYAARGNQANLIEPLLRAGATIDAASYNEITPLKCASRLGHDEVVRKLITAGAAIDRQDRCGLTPLHSAAAGNGLSVVEILLDAGAKPLKNKLGRTPLHSAAQESRSAAIIVKLLETVDIHSLDNREMTPLHIATWTGNDVAVEILLQAGANKNAVDASGKTPLQYATENRNQLSATGRSYARVYQLLANEPSEDSGICVQM